MKNTTTKFLLVLLVFFPLLSFSEEQKFECLTSFEIGVSYQFTFRYHSKDIGTVKKEGETSYVTNFEVGYSKGQFRILTYNESAKEYKIEYHVDSMDYFSEDTKRYITLTESDFDVSWSGEEYEVSIEPEMEVSEEFINALYNPIKDQKIYIPAGVDPSSESEWKVPPEKSVHFQELNDEYELKDIKSNIKKEGFYTTPDGHFLVLNYVFKVDSLTGVIDDDQVTGFFENRTTGVFSKSRDCWRFDDEDIMGAENHKEDPFVSVKVMRSSTVSIKKDNSNKAVERNAEPLRSRHPSR